MRVQVLFFAKGERDRTLQRVRANMMEDSWCVPKDASIYGRGQLGQAWKKGASVLLLHGLTEPGP